jgi:phospholipid/cholesterol/gamma-HCH transport system substrate-binding protein
MKQNAIETIMGGVVLLVAALFLVFAYSSADIAAVKGYEVTAKFDRVDGIRQGTDVRMSGIKVGTVVGEKLEPETYFALLTLSIDSSVKLPVDTNAKIVTDGLLGSKYVALEPGAEEKLLQQGGEITHTQSAINIEDLISRYIFSGSSKKDNKGGSDKSAPAPQAGPPSAKAPENNPPENNAGPKDTDSGAAKSNAP